MTLHYITKEVMGRTRVIGADYDSTNILSNAAGAPEVTLENFSAEVWGWLAYRDHRFTLNGIEQPRWPSFHQGITGRDILNKWLRVGEVLGHQSGAWIMLLKIAAAGPKGARGTDLCHGDHVQYNSRVASLRRFEKNGLIASTDKLSQRGARFYVITAKGLQFLDLDPVTP